MGSSLSVNIDNRVVLKALRKHPKIVRAALVSAINRAATQGRNAGVKAITRRYTLKAKRIKENIRVTERAKRSSLRATITANQGRVPGLQNFRAGRQLKVGVKVTVLKGKPKIIKGGFVGPGAGGKGKGLWIGSGRKTVPRKGDYKGRRLTRKSPWMAQGAREAGQRMTREFLDRQFGPSPTGMWRRRGRVKARRFIRDNIRRLVASDIEFRLKRAVRI